MSIAWAGRCRRSTPELVQQLKETHEHLNQVMLDAIAMAQHAFRAGSADHKMRLCDRG